jgi:hypothetical protein
MAESDDGFAFVGLGNGGKTMCRIIQAHREFSCKFYSFDCVDKENFIYQFSWGNLDALTNNFNNFSKLENSIGFLQEQNLPVNKLIFVVGLGGNTGTSLFKLFATSNEFSAARFVCFVPFRFEGEKRSRVANEALGFVSDLGVMIKTYPNQNLFDGAHPKETFTEAFKRQAKRVCRDLSLPSGVIALPRPEA